ncbi:hypothetical protein COCNU_14G007510 [Cocos nucifera]|uniref:Uncharacterized protein n=1 Tax=Cocos nucifera TaxID=13894 RepID=A0A8K0IVY0_COCNU|nr:hypothetical protein COCNU_14G007510 [Cocos nucifera]
MGVAGRERGVLKLVHPGGLVEVHRQPVVAADIMAKNPRHSITGTDVFKNPRLVVRPDALPIKTGDMFYTVPNRTLYRLMQNSNCV